MPALALNWSGLANAVGHSNTTLFLLISLPIWLVTLGVYSFGGGFWGGIGGVIVALLASSTLVGLVVFVGRPLGKYHYPLTFWADITRTKENSLLRSYIR